MKDVLCTSCILLFCFFIPIHNYSQPANQNFTGTGTGNIRVAGVPQTTFVAGGVRFTVVQPSSLSFQTSNATTASHMCIQNSGTGSFWGYVDPARGNYLCRNMNMDAFAGGASTPTGDGGTYASGPTELRIGTDNGSEFKFVSMYVDVSYSEYDYNFTYWPTTIKGYLNNVEVSSVVVSFTVNGNVGTGNNFINYTQVSGYDGGGGTINFSGSNWQNIDEIRITSSTSLVLTVDNLQFAAAISGLPVVWQSISATPENEGILVKWKTSEEHNTAHYAIERSTDARNYAEAGTRPSLNIPGDVAYAYLDRNVSKGNQYFYRIRQVDRDGKFSFSSIVRARYGEADGKRLTVSSNPFNDKLAFTYMADKESKIKVMLIDVTGKIVLSTAIITQKGINSISLPVVRVTTGSYVLVVAGEDNEREEVKLIK